MSRVRRWGTTVALVTLAACSGRADDVVVENGPGGRAAVPVPQQVVNLVQWFDRGAFGDSSRVMIMEESPRGPGATDNAAVVARQLEPIRRRLERKIATIDRLAALSDEQRKKLEIASQVDMRRVTAAVTEARAKYAGRLLAIDPREGMSEEGAEVIAEAERDASRCRGLISGAAGSSSLVDKVLADTLDEKQAATYARVTVGRAACRWKAVVTEGLADLDDHAGFSQKQHDALAAVLLGSPPPAATEGDGRTALPAVGHVARLLVALGHDRLAAILDPRQEQVVAHAAAHLQMMDGAGGMEIGGLPFHEP